MGGRRAPPLSPAEGHPKRTGVDTAPAIPGRAGRVVHQLLRGDGDRPPSPPPPTAGFWGMEPARPASPTPGGGLKHSGGGGGPPPPPLGGHRQRGGGVARARP